MIHIGNFEGIGGFSLAATRMGWKTYATCEKVKWRRAILQYYWPNAYHHDDIHTFTYNILDATLKEIYGQHWRSERIVLTGGFPCQPYSHSGKRLGKDDDRHLWPEMFRTLWEIQPAWFVGENVYGIFNWSEGVVFEEVQADLEEIGYSIQPIIIPAAGVGAPHKRDRVWFIAYRNDRGYEDRRMDGSEVPGSDRSRRTSSPNNTKAEKRGEVAANTRSKQREKRPQEQNEQDKKEREAELDNRTSRYGNTWNAANTELSGPYRAGSGEAGQKEGETQGQGNKRKRIRTYTERDATKADVANSNTERLQRRHGAKERKASERLIEAFNSWHVDGTDVANTAERRRGKEGDRKFERATKYDKDSPGEVWKNFPTQSPVCSRDDGFSSKLDVAAILKTTEKRITKRFDHFKYWRRQSLMALGDSIVHQIALEIFQAIQHVENELHNKC